MLQYGSMEHESWEGAAGIEALDLNRERARLRRRSFWLSVVLPFALSAALVGALVFVVVRTGFGGVRGWADTSLVFLLAPLLLLCLLPLALIALLVYGSARLIGWLPDPMQVLDARMRRLAKITDRLSRGAVKPWISMQAFWAALRAAFLRLRAGSGAGRGDWHG